MTMITVDPNGEAILRKAVLEEAGARAGDTLEVHVRVVRPRNPTGGKAVTWDDLAGSMVPPTGVRLTIEEIKEATEKAWAGER